MSRPLDALYISLWVLMLLHVIRPVLFSGAKHLSTDAAAS